MLDVPTFNDVSELRKEVARLSAALESETRRLKAMLVKKDKIIYKLRKKSGIKARVNKKDVMDMIESGATTAEITEKLGVHRKTVYRAKQLMGII